MTRLIITPKWLWWFTESLPTGKRRMMPRASRKKLYKESKLSMVMLVMF